MKTYTKEEMIAIVSKVQRYEIYWEQTGWDGEGELIERVDWETGAQGQPECRWINFEELLSIINSLE